MHRVGYQQNNKYRAQKTAFAGRVYDSKAEANRAYELNMLLRAGVVTDVKQQVRYPIEVNNTRICVYIADFVVTYPDGHIEVEDVKGVLTPVYRLKKKLFETIYKTPIHEISK